MRTLEVLQKRVDTVVLAMKATTTAVRDKRWRARRDFECEGGSSSQVKNGKEATNKKLWINGRVNEDQGAMGRMEMRARCERCFDDEEESTQVQEGRMNEQWARGNSREAWKGERVEVTVGRGLRA